MTQARCPIDWKNCSSSLQKSLRVWARATIPAGTGDAVLEGRLSSMAAEAAATGTEDSVLAPATTPSLGQLVSGAVCSGDRVVGSPVCRGPGTRAGRTVLSVSLWLCCTQARLRAFPGCPPSVPRLWAARGLSGLFPSSQALTRGPSPHGCVTADDRVCSVVKGCPRWDPQGMASGIGQNWGQVLRGDSQGQEKVEPVVEASRQPHGAKVLHYRGQQVPWTGHGG